MIDLPTWPAPNGAVPRVLDFGGFLEAPGGAETQRVNQLGNRYAVAFSMPPLDNHKEGRIWVNRLLKGMKQGARIAYPLLDFDPGAPNVSAGTPIIVDGANQAGLNLAVQNVQPHYFFREGQPVSLEIGGQHFFDFVAENVAAGSDGKATIQLTQMIRKPPPAGSVLHVARPMIEGFIMGDPVSWEIAIERNFGLSFEISESR